MNRPWMPLYVADYLADTAHLRAAESGAYMHLIMHYWRHGELPHNDRLLSSIARMTPEEWALAKPLIEPLFKAGTWKHKRIEAELTKVAQRAEAGRKGGKAKANGKQKASEQASETPSETPSAPVSVTVLTDSHSPQEEPSLESDERKKVRPVDTRARARRGARLPADWLPSDEDFGFAVDLIGGQRSGQEVPKFKDYWQARAGPGGVKLDWSATWRNWIRKALEDGTNRRTGSANRGQGFSAYAIECAREAAGHEPPADD